MCGKRRTHGFCAYASFIHLAPGLACVNVKCLFSSWTPIMSILSQSAQATFHSERTNKQQCRPPQSVQMAQRKRKRGDGCCYYTALSEFFHPQRCRAQIAHGRSWRNHKTSTLVWKMNQVWEPASLFVLLNYNKGHTLDRWQNEGEAQEKLGEFTSISPLPFG